MRCLALFIVLSFMAPASGADLMPRPPAKPPIDATPAPPDAAVLRQGGDTIADAVPLSIPYQGSGTTTGYTHDYDEACPYGGSSSPDVVYAVTPATDMIVSIDLAGSTYDTKVYVYDAALTLLACNDDFYPDYVSFLEQVPLVGGAVHYVVIDGYGGEHGEYVLSITPFEPCVLACPSGAQLEGEPPLEDGYEDAFNGGCQWPQFGNNFSTITSSIYCAVSGWYQSSDGGTRRDDDYIEAYLPASGVLEVTGVAEQPTYLFHVGPTDCASFAILQTAYLAPCEPEGLTITGAPGELIWLFVVPTTFEGPVSEYDYILETNLDPVAAQPSSWSTVKGMFD